MYLLLLCLLMAVVMIEEVVMEWLVLTKLMNCSLVTVAIVVAAGELVAAAEATVPFDSAAVSGDLATVSPRQWWLVISS